MKAPVEFQQAFSRCPLIAILRGIEPSAAAGIGDALAAAGFTLIEVPLNSPSPLESIEILSRRLGSQVLVGAGTVLHVDQVREVRTAGGRLIVSPNTNPAVIDAAAIAGMASLPGYATVSEAFVAIDAGAHALKLFPAEATTPAALRAQRAVIPASIPVIPVGGIAPVSFKSWVDAGASGFGLGSALYKPGQSADAVAAAAERMVTRWRSL